MAPAGGQRRCPAQDRVGGAAGRAAPGKMALGLPRRIPGEVERRGPQRRGQYGSGGERRTGASRNDETVTDQRIIKREEAARFRGVLGALSPSRFTGTLGTGFSRRIGERWGLAGNRSITPAQKNF